MNEETVTALLCPACGQRMVVRTNTVTGEDFLGCSAYPDCRHTQPLPIDQVMRRQGAPELPGF